MDIDLSQQALAIYSSTENLYHSGKSTANFKTSVRIKGKRTKIRLARQFINNRYQKDPRNS